MTPAFMEEEADNRTHIFEIRDHLCQQWGGVESGALGKSK